MPKTNSESYRPDIDGLRALAVLPVLLFHAKLGCPGGFVGVDIFYVISGYLISSLILKDLDDGTFSLISFWERRIRRILPALLVVVFATIVVGWFLFLPEDFAMLCRSVIAQAMLLANVYFYRKGLVGVGYFTPTPAPEPLLHTWSLAVEEQFYLFFPLLLIFLARYGRRRLINAITVLAVGSFVLSVYGSYVHPQATFYLLPARAWELALGALLALLRGRIAVGVSAREMCGWLGIGLIGYAIFFYDAKIRFPGLTAIPPCLGAALIIYSSESKLSFVGRRLAFKPVVFIGLISYSLYLWHWPLLVFLRYVSREEPSATVRATLLIISIVLAILTWKYIEKPFRKKWVLPKRQQIFGFSAVSTAILLVLGFEVSHAHGIPSRLSANVFLRYREYKNHDALTQISVERALAGQYINIGSPNTNQPVKLLIWGDSHAMAITPALDDVCRKYSWHGELVAFFATAPVLGFVSKGDYALNETSPIVASAVLKFIIQEHVENVVIAANWGIYPPSDLFKAQLLKTVHAIVDSGARVYVVKDVPAPGFNAPRYVAFASLFNDDLDQLGITREQHQMADRSLAMTFEQISQIDGAMVLDPAPYFLNKIGKYGVVKNNQVLYMDSHHLTVEGAKILTPLFEETFKAN